MTYGKFCVYRDSHHWVLLFPHTSVRFQFLRFDLKRKNEYQVNVYTHLCTLDIINGLSVWTFWERYKFKQSLEVSNLLISVLSVYLNQIFTTYNRVSVCPDRSTSTKNCLPFHDQPKIMRDRLVPVTHYTSSDHNTLALRQWLPRPTRILLWLKIRFVHNRKTTHSSVSRYSGLNPYKTDQNTL